MVNLNYDDLFGQGLEAAAEGGTAAGGLGGVEEFIGRLGGILEQANRFLEQFSALRGNPALAGPRPPGVGAPPPMMTPPPLAPPPPPAAVDTAQVQAALLGLFTQLCDSPLGKMPIGQLYGMVEGSSLAQLRELLTGGGQ